MKVELGLPRESRIRPKDLLKLVNDNFERLNELSPLVDKKSIKSFKGKYKKSTIERPPIVNGLEEIGIYTNSEFEDEADPPAAEQVNLIIGSNQNSTNNETVEGEIQNDDVNV